MKSAICIFRIDTVSGKYEAEWHDMRVEGIFQPYLSDSPKITDQHIKYAVGKKQYDQLWQEYLDWLENNNKS
jgi:hypothetical protein